MRGGILLFHQGWTDIINCLPLISYYCTKYEKLFLYIRDDSRELVSFFCDQIENAEVLFVQKNLLNNNKFINSLTKKHSGCDLLIHGESDYLRNDQYRFAFASNNKKHFATRFYNNYDLDRNFLNSKIHFERDREAEERVYENFISTHGQEYVLKHSTEERVITINHPLKIVELGGLTTNPFYYLKVLENSAEIHVIDSFWATFCFLMEEKEKMFSKNNKKITLYYLNRPGGLLPNDNIVSKYHNWSVNCN